MTEISLSIPDGTTRVGIAAARFNHFITRQLLEGALDAFTSNGLGRDDITIAWVPGAFELPLAADRMLATGQFDAVLALGAVVRGGTPHFEYVAGECSRGLTDVSLKHGLPVLFGVLTTDTVEQALERAGAGEGNKGYDVAVAALNMINLMRKLPDGPGDG